MHFLRSQRALTDHYSLPPDGQLAPCGPAAADVGSLLAPPRQFNPAHPEMIDRPGLAPALLLEELKILEYANRRLGGCRLVIDSVKRLLGANRPASISILDLATGMADIPRALVAWGRAEQLAITATAADNNLEVLRLAKQACSDWPEIRLEDSDLRELPYTPESFDVVICSLALHHFGSVEAVGILRRIRESARMGYIVNDLRRNWFAIGLTELLTRTVIRSTIVRNDARQSCRAAFTLSELRAMAGLAGMKRFRLTRHHGPFRMVLEGRK